MNNSYLPISPATLPFLSGQSTGFLSSCVHRGEESLSSRFLTQWNRALFLSMAKFSPYKMSYRNVFLCPELLYVHLFSFFDFVLDIFKAGFA